MLKDGYLYHIHARNAQYGIWIEKEQAFILPREKFGNVYLFMEYHYDMGEPYGTAKEIMEIEKAPFEDVSMNNHKLLLYLLKFEVEFYKKEYPNHKYPTTLEKLYLKELKKEE